MASTSLSPHPLLPLRHHRAVSVCSFPWLFFHFPSPPRALPLRAIAGEAADAQNPASPRKPLASSVVEFYDDVDEEERESRGGDEGDEGDEEQRYTRVGRRMRRDPEWVDWEDRILEDTVPLVGFVRMILHSGKYESGEKLVPEHEKTIIERLLIHHPQCESKIGCGIDYLTIGFHPDYESSRCLFIVRKDGELVDFSYWKCIKSFIRKKYPLHADVFILRHFQKRRSSNYHRNLPL